MLRFSLFLAFLLMTAHLSAALHAAEFSPMPHQHAGEECQLDQAIPHSGTIPQPPATAWPLLATYESALSTPHNIYSADALSLPESRAPPFATA